MYILDSITNACANKENAEDPKVKETESKGWQTPPEFLVLECIAVQM